MALTVPRERVRRRLASEADALVKVVGLGRKVGAAARRARTDRRLVGLPADPCATCGYTDPCGGEIERLLERVPDLATGDGRPQSPTLAERPSV